MESTEMNTEQNLSEVTVRAESLSKRFGKENAVRDLNLKLESGSVYALLGPNGAGKSTTLKMLLGVVDPNSGESEILGENSKRLSPETLQKVGYVSENQKLPDWMTLSRLIKYLKPYYPTWDDELVSSLLERFELPLDRKLKAMSRGMRMRVKLVTALGYHPRVLLLDEPFAGLDPVACEICTNAILDWSQEGERTALISSHEIEDVERLADRVGMIEKGRLILDEEVDALKDRVRRVTVLSKELLSAEASLREGWTNLEVSGRCATFVDTQCSEGQVEDEVKTVFPGVEQVESEFLSLREIYLSLAKREQVVAEV